MEPMWNPGRRSPGEVIVQNGSFGLPFGALEATVGGFLVFTGGVSDFGGFFEGSLIKNDLIFDQF